MTGPYESREQARNSPEVIAIRQASGRGPGSADAGNDEMLRNAICAAGVDLGHYDQRVVRWLAGWEPELCAVVAGLIRRAHESGRAAAADEGGE